MFLASFANFVSSDLFSSSIAGQITFSCEFDLMDFPADVQTCTAKFASFVYPAQYLKFLAPLPFLEVSGVDVFCRWLPYASQCLVMVVLVDRRKVFHSFFLLSDIYMKGSKRQKTYFSACLFSHHFIPG